MLSASFGSSFFSMYIYFLFYHQSGCGVLVSQGKGGFNFSILDETRYIRLQHLSFYFFLMNHFNREICSGVHELNILL